jgi:colicin import membrane protein
MRKLKTYQTSLGFFDLAIAAPSMKAALEAWGSETNLFHQGLAKETDDPAIIAAAMAKPGVVLRRAVGSNVGFSVHAALPKDPPAVEVNGTRGKRILTPPAASPPRKFDDNAAREAAIAYAREQDRRDRERAGRRVLRKRNAGAAARRLRRPKLRSTRLDEPTTPRPKRLQPRVLRSTGRRKPKKTDGISSGRNCRRH